MEQSEIIEGNRLIAVFHGWKHIPTPKGKGKGYWDFPEWKRASWSEESLEYHRSWDWLMPVVDKVESLTVEDGRGPVNFIVSMDSTYCVISQGGEGVVADYQGDNRMECTYHAILRFIRWYNSQSLPKQPLK